MIVYKSGFYIALALNIYYSITGNKEMVDRSFQILVMLGFLSLISRR